jgi:hypothetical protein
MLSINDILEYVKINLGFPMLHLELEDNQIINYIQKFTIKEFSYYIPDKNTVPLNTNLESSKVPGKSNEYYIWDPEGLEILNVIDIYLKPSELYFLGHPPIGPMSLGELKDWALATSNAMMLKMFSSYDYTFEFKHPNIIRISPALNTNLGVISIEYERQQPPDLSGIPNDLHTYFKDIALADIMIMLGRIRKRYSNGNLKTPFGDIPLESDIFDEGKELKSKTLETLERLYIPNVRVDHG